MTGRENIGTWKYRHCGRQASYKTSSFECDEVRRTTNQSNVNYRDMQPINLVTIWCRCVTNTNWTTCTHMWTLVPTYRYHTALRINWLQKSIKSFQVPRCINSSSCWAWNILLFFVGSMLRALSHCGPGSLRLRQPHSSWHWVVGLM